MNALRTVLAATIVAAAAVTGAAAQSATWVRPNRPAAPSAQSATCALFSTISSTFDAAPGVTNGIPVLPLPGETFTVSVAGPGSGSFRIVADSSGINTFAGPASVPGTLSYTAGTSLPPNTEGVGFYFDAGQGTVTLTASCRGATSPAPALGGRSLLLLGALLALIAGTFASRRLRAPAARNLRS